MRQVRIEDSSGKRLKTCVHKWDGSELLLIYEDGTYSFLEIQLGHDPGEKEIVNGRFDILRFGEMTLVEAGVLDATEAREMREKYNALREAAAQKKERQQYEMLRRKFE